MYPRLIIVPRDFQLSILEVLGNIPMVTLRVEVPGEAMSLLHFHEL